PSRLPASRIWESSTGKMLSAETRWKRILLFEGKLDWFFFLTRDELISLNDSSTGIPTQDCVVLTWGANRFGSFEPAHRLTQEVVGLKPASRRLLPQFHLRATFRYDSGIVRALIV